MAGSSVFGLQRVAASSEAVKYSSLHQQLASPERGIFLLLFSERVEQQHSPQVQLVHRMQDEAETWVLRTTSDASNLSRRTESAADAKLVARHTLDGQH